MEPEPSPASAHFSISTSGETAVGQPSPQSSPKVGGPGERRVSTATTRAIQTGSNDNGAHKDLPAAPAPGWPHLAQVMAEIPEFAAFPRFKDLNTKNLLYYQAQLKNLRSELHNQEHLSPEKYAERADILMKHEDTEHFKLIMKLRTLLSEYNEALLQYSKISELPDPEAYNMHSLRNWLSDTNPGGGEFRVRNEKSFDNTWGDIGPDAEKKNRSLWTQFQTLIWALILAKPPPKEDLDLVTTHPPSKIDGLTKWGVYYLVPFYWAIKDRFGKKNASGRTDVEKSQPVAPPGKPILNLNPRKPLKKKKKKTIESISEATALKFTSALSTVIACLMPVVAIAVLSQLHGTRDLLLCITGFAVIFAVGLIFLTQGTSTRTEIFAATAAFSAVMVVFISQPIIKVPPGVPPPVVSPP